MATTYDGVSPLEITAPGVGEDTRLRVLLMSSADPTVGATGVLYSAVTATVCKPDAASFVAFPTWGTDNWAELGYGWYEVIIRNSEADELALLDTCGDWLLRVEATACEDADVLRRVVSADAARDDVWTDTRAGYLDAAVTSREASGAAASALTSYDPPTKAELDSAVSPLATSAALTSGLDALPTAAENADAVWDEATAGHTTAGTFGDAITDIVAGIDPDELQAAVAAALLAYDAANGTDIAGVAASVWTYATRTITDWVDLFAEISESALSGIEERTRTFYMYYGDNEPITGQITTSGGSPYNLTGATLELAITSSELDGWDDAKVTLTSEEDGGITVTSPTGGSFSFSFTDAQLEELPQGFEGHYTLKSKVSTVRRTLLSGTWNVRGAADRALPTT
jgi:hypothetical protein